jgi:hypothetical protein
LDVRIDAVIATVEYLHRTAGAIPSVVTLVDSTAAKPYFNANALAPQSANGTTPGPEADLRRAAAMLAMEAAAMGGQYSSSKTAFYIHTRLAAGVRHALSGARGQQ